METYSSAFVCLMGIGTVFFGLICLILLTKVMSFLCGAREQPAQQAAAPSVTAPEPNQELVAAISAAIAEDLGTDVTGIRILSIKKL